MAIKRVVAVTFDARVDRELIAKLNAVAPYYRKKVHTLVRDVMTEWLDNAIGQLGIEVDYRQAS